MMANAAGFTWALLAMVALTQAKPLDPPINESINEIDHGNASLQKKNSLTSEERQQNSTLPTNEASITAAAQFDATNSAAGTLIDATVQSLEQTSTKPGPLSWFLTPWTQKIQFSPQSFLQDRLMFLKETLNTLGLSAALQNATGKQLGSNGLLHLVGPNDSGFYTNRLEPAGFLGGNGWFANKGGILGGPGAILSTGSLFTDYPTAYRRR